MARNTAVERADIKKGHAAEKESAEPLVMKQGKVTAEQEASVSKASGGATGLASFAALDKGAAAPWWLLRGVCDAWDLDMFTTELRLITVSENATFLVVCKNKPYGVVRVSQPGYVGGPVAVASEIAWIDALHSVEGVSLVRSIPTASGFSLATITDEEGVAWACVCTGFVEGVVLEDMPDPSSYYRTIGRWAAAFHDHARTWRPPAGFQRFTWDVPDMIGESPRWGRWEETKLTCGEIDLLKRAERVAVDVMEHMPRTKETWGLIHADLRPSNVIAGAEGALTIIDFDDCGYSWYLYDYAAALSFVEHEPYAPAMAQEWIAGYREVAPLSEEDITCASALSMIRRLQMLGWTTNHYADALPDGLFDAQGPGTVLCAERYLRSQTWLLEA